ncbi:MAG: endo-1,4-beta-xylanase [Clostridia bacterium]|nr:endo-1,4-beta-xylanase [Clostridia bacterium]
MNLTKYRETFASLRPQIDADIEAYRKADATIRVVGGDGKAVPGAKIKLRQDTHEFNFGCNCVKLGSLGVDNERYEMALARLFNLVTTTFCLSVIEPNPGEWRFAEGSKEIFRRPPPDRVVKFAHKYGLRLKGQPLLAGSWFPEWAKDFSQDEVRALYTDYFRRVAERYGSTFDIFDIVNEAFLHTKFPLYTEDCTYVDWAFEEAAKLFPAHTVMELNEATDINYGKGAQRYFNLVSRILEKGIRLDSVGFQFHQFTENAGRKHINGEYLALEEIYQTYRRFNELGVPLYITEVTVPSNYTALSRAEGEAIQAEVVDTLYRLWFSIPNMTGINYWNLSDGVNWLREGDCLGCLTDENVYEKPAYHALYQLLNREWKTKALLESDDGGQASLRGFKGGYTGTVTVDNREVPFAFDLRDGCEPVTVVV